MSDYSDIINLTYSPSKSHKHMSNHDRAAQFAPFAALTGYEQIIKEVARITTKRIELGADQKEKINEVLVKLRNSEGLEININVTYFIADKKKSGGKYISISGLFYKFDSEYKYLFLKDKTKINTVDILDIEII